jgi:hypothetical protein
VNQPRHSADPVKRLFALFAHERGPTEPVRSLPFAVLREWPTLWTTDPQFLPLLGDQVRALLQNSSTRLRYFSATDPDYPTVPLLPVNLNEAPRAVDSPGIRDKFWQRLVVAGAGNWLQPNFATVTGTRIEANNTPWHTHITALDCRPVRPELLSAVASGTVVVAEGTDVGFTAVVAEDGIHLETGSPHIAARLNGRCRCTLSRVEWGQFVDALCAEPLPLGTTRTAFGPTAELGATLLCAPGAYILKPRFGSNGFCVVRITSADDHLTVESDCPDTALYLDEFPRNPDLRGQDLVAAVTTHRTRFINRATAGLPDQLMNQSVLEEEIRQDRVDGAIFEPRIVIQRAKVVSGERFVTLGAIAKRIESAVGASVACDFSEEPLDCALRNFLRERVPDGDLAHCSAQTRAEILEAGDRLREVLTPLLAERGARVHQFGIDCRLCWNRATGRAEYPFLEFQFGIGRITPPALTPALAGYKTRDELSREFGPEVG